MNTCLKRGAHQILDAKTLSVVDYRCDDGGDFIMEP